MQPSHPHHVSILSPTPNTALPPAPPPLPPTRPPTHPPTHPPQEYLAERGVDEALGAYLQDLVWDKENQEYMAWLGAVHGFVAGGGK